MIISLSRESDRGGFSASPPLATRPRGALAGIRPSRPGSCMPTGGWVTRSASRLCLVHRDVAARNRAPPATRLLSSPPVPDAGRRTGGQARSYPPVTVILRMSMQTPDNTDARCARSESKLLVPAATTPG
jgi:hypothetical protein